MRIGETLKMTYPIYDLNDRNATTPVNIKELEEEDEAELKLLSEVSEVSEAANNNNSTPFVDTEETATTATTRRLRSLAFVIGFLIFGGLIGWAVSTYVDTTENERASFTRKEYFHVLKHEFFPEGSAGVQPKEAQRNAS